MWISPLLAAAAASAVNPSARTFVEVPSEEPDLWVRNGILHAFRPLHLGLNKVVREPLPGTIRDYLGLSDCRCPSKRLKGKSKQQPSGRRNQRSNRKSKGKSKEAINDGLKDPVNGRRRQLPKRRLTSTAVFEISPPAIGQDTVEESGTAYRITLDVAVCCAAAASILCKGSKMKARRVRV